MDSAAHVLRVSSPSSERTTRDNQRCSSDDMELEKGASIRRSSEGGPPPFNRTRSFKTKQLVRSQAINESHSPPRQPSPRLGDNRFGKPAPSVKKKSASIDLSDGLKNLALDHDRSVSPSNNNNTRRNNMNLTKKNSNSMSGGGFKGKGGNNGKVEFHQVEIQVSSGDGDSDISNQSSETRGGSRHRNNNNRRYDTQNSELDDDKDIQDVEVKRNGDGVVRRGPCSKQDSGISCWESFTCCEESISLSDAEDDIKIREEGDHLHHLIESCRCSEKEKWVGRKTATTLSVTRINSGGGNPRLMRKQSSGGSIDSSHSLQSPYMSRDNSYEMGAQKSHVGDKDSVSSFIKEILNKNLRDRMTLLKLEKEMVSLIRDPIRREQSFPAATSYGRLLIHRCAEAFSLKHGVDPITKHVYVMKPPHESDAVCRVPPLSPFSQWCTATFTSSPTQHFEEAPAKSILKRDVHSLDEDGLSSSNRFSQQARSKSFEQREEEYERVRRRIFNSPGREESEHYCEYDAENPQIEIVRPKVLIARPEQRQGRLLKVQSLEQRENNSGTRAPVSKAHSFGGYGGRQNSIQAGGPGMRREDSITSTHSAPPPTILSRQGEAARNSWLSPGSSGYKTLSGRTESITPSPTATPAPNTESAEGGAKTNVLWVVTDMSNVPVGAVIIHPQTGQALTNSDGTVYHYDPEKPPHAALLQNNLLNVENQKEKRRSRLEKQQAMLSPGTDTDHLSPIDKRILPDSREFSPIKSPKSEQCDPIIEDDFSVSDASSHSHCQCCREESAKHKDQQPPSASPSCSSKPPDLNSVKEEASQIAEEEAPPPVFNGEVQNRPESADPCNECINMEGYCGEDYGGEFQEYCEYQNQEVETYQTQETNLHYNMRSSEDVQAPLTHPQMMYGVPQDSNVGFNQPSEMVYGSQMVYSQNYRVQETDVHAQYQMIQAPEQLPHQMLVTVPKPPEPEVPGYVAYPTQATFESRQAQVQQMAYQVPGWNCWPQMVYNQPNQPQEEPIQKFVNPPTTPNPYVQVHGDPSMAIPQVFYQHPANLIPPQHAQYVYNQISMPHIPAAQPQYPVYQAYPPQPALFNIPPPQRQPEVQTPRVKSPDKFIYPPVIKSPKNNQQQNSASASLRNTPLTESYCPQDASYFPYYMQQGAPYPPYYQMDYAAAENNPYLPQQKDEKQESPKNTSKVPDNKEQEKQEIAKNTPTPTRVITPQGDVIKYNNPNAKLQNFQFDKNVNVEKMLAEKKAAMTAVATPTPPKDGILGSPNNRFAFNRQQSLKDYRAYHNFPRNISRNPNRRSNTSSSKDREFFEKTTGNDVIVPSSPLQRTPPNSAFHWSQKNQNEKPSHVLQRSQSQTEQSPPLLPFPPSPGLLPSLYHMRPAYNPNQRRNPRNAPPGMAQLPGSAMQNFTMASNTMGLIQAASQQEMLFRQLPWLRRAAAAAPPLLGPAPQLMGSHGRQQRMSRPPHHTQHHHQQQQYR